LLAALFGFTVLAGLAGAIWEWVGISRLLVRDHPEESGAVAYPALRRKIENTVREPEFPRGLPYQTPISPYSPEGPLTS
jgi:hypothetical protein